MCVFDILPGVRPQCTTYNVQHKPSRYTHADPSQMAKITDGIVQFIIKWQMPTEEMTKKTGEITE